MEARVYRSVNMSPEDWFASLIPRSRTTAQVFHRHQPESCRAAATTPYKETAPTSAGRSHRSVEINSRRGVQPDPSSVLLLLRQYRIRSAVGRVAADQVVLKRSDRGAVHGIHPRRVVRHGDVADANSRRSAIRRDAAGSVVCTDTTLEIDLHCPSRT